MEQIHFTEKQNAPIAVFDSGVGGISVLGALVKEMPYEDFWYMGDSANAPYGTKSLEEVRRLTAIQVERFIICGVKAVVVACNTATSAAVRFLREQYPDEIIVGIEPALKPAAYVCENPNVVVMATPVTLREEKFHKLMDRYRDRANITPLPCPGLMEYIEQGKAGTEELLIFVDKLFSHVDKENLDAVVLGCTHYPFAKNEICKVLGPNVQLFDGAPGTARETRRRIKEAGLLRDETHIGRITYENSLNSDEKINICKRLLEKSLGKE
ncbi:MAG: glutamate racemase [Eubacteriales bacterium]|nr:glutamate racemase [Lachnospiraceae bacterium]MDO5126856.1 glutamate racemase [Eubacteriales bacterium]